jgi:glycosyltransferase involved in cell wall biosynthesis
MCAISVIIPVYNGEKWVENCMQSIAAQTIHRNNNVKLEIVVYDDGSTDNTLQLLQSWAKYFNDIGVEFTITGAASSKGCGAAKNGAVRKSSGTFLCFQDIDDVMLPERISLQWSYACNNHNALIGSRISRLPIDSTPRYVQWANNLSPSQLKTQIYTSNGPTLLMPTWFCHRSVYDKVGGFDESGKGTPEDLIFFYKHIDLGGDLHRIDEELVIYTYYLNGATFSVTRERIWNIQLKRLENCVLSNWKEFTVWNAGKAGRKLVRTLSQINMEKVISFCDVDKKKIGQTIELYCPKKRLVIKKIPVVDYRDAKPPLLICMKLDLTKGEFECNLKSMNLIEGLHYVLFS